VNRPGFPAGSDSREDGCRLSVELMLPVRLMNKIFRPRSVSSPPARPSKASGDSEQGQARLNEDAGGHRRPRRLRDPLTRQQQVVEQHRGHRGHHESIDQRTIGVLGGFGFAARAGRRNEVNPPRRPRARRPEGGGSPRNAPDSRARNARWERQASRPPAPWVERRRAGSQTLTRTVGSWVPVPLHSTHWQDA
jgi:hypothetical protein